MIPPKFITFECMDNNNKYNLWIQQDNGELMLLLRDIDPAVVLSTLYRIITPLKYVDMNKAFGTQE